MWRRAGIGMGASKNWTVITTCTSRKRLPPIAAAAALSEATQGEVLAQWLGKLRTITDVHAIRDVYAGRGLKLAEEAAAAVGSGLSVVSAGLGFVSNGTSIPSYDLTISTGSEASVTTKVKSGFDSTAWWDGLRSSPFASSLTSGPIAKSEVLIALSEPYARMIAADLERLMAAGCALRIFGSSLQKHLPKKLAPFVMPYDERLSDLISGTKTDFPQRALLHFVREVAPKTLTLAEEYAAVTTLLGTVGTRPRKLPIRMRHSDDEIAEMIRSLPAAIRRSKSKSLMYLRRELGVACEQNRFSKIFSEVGAQHGD